MRQAGQHRDRSKSNSTGVKNIAWQHWQLVHRKLKPRAHHLFLVRHVSSLEHNLVQRMRRWRDKLHHRYQWYNGKPFCKTSGEILTVIWESAGVKCSAVTVRPHGFRENICHEGRQCGPECEAAPGNAVTLGGARGDRGCELSVSSSELWTSPNQLCRLKVSSKQDAQL